MISIQRENKIFSGLLLLLFFLIPFQNNLRGVVYSLSRSLTRPDIALPSFFCHKIQLFISDLVIVALILFLFYRCKISFREFFCKGPSLYLTLLFFIYLLSTATSITKNYSLQYFRLLEFSLIFLFFNAICILKNKIDFSKFVYKLAWIFVFTALFECTVSNIQYFTQKAVGLEFLGEKSPHLFLFMSDAKSLWLFGSKNAPPFLCRACGTFIHPNVLGGFLFSSLMASYFLCVQTEKRGRRFFLFSMIILQLFTLYLSFSRSAMLALFLSTLLWCALQLKNTGDRSKVFKRMKGILLGMFFCVLAGLFLFYPQLKARGGFFNYNSVTQNADSERVLYMQVALDNVKEHPMLGIGYNNFQIYGGAHDDRLFSKVHNIYLLVASEAGLIGGGLFVLFIFSILHRAYKALKPGVPDENFQQKALLFCLFFGFLVIGFCDFYFLESPRGSILFFGIAGLIYATHSKHSCVLYRSDLKI